MAAAQVQTNGHTNPKITFYTNRRCPYAHRADITLQELGLPYEEVIIDLDTPRPAWYLDINPRGLVPALKYSNDGLNDEILYESSVVSQFLTDTTSNHLLPASNSDPKSALSRARVQFFVDTWTSKMSPFTFAFAKLDSEDEREAKAKELMEVLKKEIEPLLKDANPFFGGSSKLTFAETQIAPFLIRLYTLANGELYPKSLKDGLNSLPNLSKWTQAVIAHPSVNHAYDFDDISKHSAIRLAKLRAQSK